MLTGRLGWPLVIGGTIVLAGALCARAQQPLPPAPPASPQEPAPPPQPQPGTKPSKHSHANDVVIRGTVFTPRGFSFRGAELRLRRSGEKKFRWGDVSNFRGEFALRVPQGVEYELVVRAHGYAEQLRRIDATTGERYVDLVFRMQPASGGKRK